MFEANTVRMARGRNNKKPSSSKKKTGEPGKGKGKGQAEASSLQTSSSEALQYPKVMEGSAEGRQGKETPSSSSFENVAKPEEPKKVDFRGKEKESLPAHDTTSLRGDSENFSSRMEDERRRTHSLACERVRDNTAPAEVQATRTEAITLIRARTLSRLSDTDQPSGEFLEALLQEKPASPKEPSEFNRSSDNMVYETANIMDYVVNKKNKKKGKNAAAEEQLLAELAKNEDSNVSPPDLQEEQDISVKLDAGDQVAPVSGKQITDEQCSNNKVDKGKKCAVVVDADVLLESEGANKNVTLPEADPSTEDKKSNATEEVTEAVKALEVTEAKDPKTSQSSSKQASCGRSNSKKEPLSSIKEGQAQEASASESPVVGASTPKSTGTTSVSTGWTPTSNQATLITADSAPSTERRGKSAKKSSGKAASTSTTQPISNHAHPSPVTNCDIQQPSTQGGRSITSKKPDNFFWQLDSHGFPCSKQFCEKRCNLCDGATVICPRCGPYSEVRYCSRRHLLEDVKAHWLICGEMSFRHPCVDSSIPSSVRDSPPLIPSQLPHNSLERHRQAVHFNMNTRAGDYFIFSDWADMIAAKSTPDDITLRCSSRIIHTVKFTDPVEKDRFRRVLAACLFVTFESCPLVDYLFRMIRDKLPSTSESASGTEVLTSLESSLKYQVFREFTVRIQPHITGKRHACPSDWTGRNRRNCPDEVCRAERKRLLGTLGGSGHEALIQHLEASYWILRVSRTTHPTVSSAKERMMGNGFEDVAEEDCRHFCRGDGWDGPGSGDMEIEEANN